MYFIHILFTLLTIFMALDNRNTALIDKFKNAIRPFILMPIFLGMIRAKDTG